MDETCDFERKCVSVLYRLTHLAFLMLLTCSWAGGLLQGWEKAPWDIWLSYLWIVVGPGLCCRIGQFYSLALDRVISVGFWRRFYNLPCCGREFGLLDTCSFLLRLKLDLLSCDSARVRTFGGGYGEFAMSCAFRCRLVIVCLHFVIHRVVLSIEFCGSVALRLVLYNLA